MYSIIYSYIILICIYTYSYTYTYTYTYTYIIHSYFIYICTYIILYTHAHIYMYIKQRQSEDYEENGKIKCRLETVFDCCEIERLKFYPPKIVQIKSIAQ